MARYFRRGKSKIKFLPAVANQAAPTAPELTAGTDLTPQVAEINGFQLSNSPIPVPNLQDQFTPQIDGEDTVADSSLTLYDDDTASTIRTALAKGVSGFIALMPYGQTSTKRVEIWPVKSTGVNDEWTTGNDPARFTIGFAVTGVPTQGGVLP